MSVGEEQLSSASMLAQRLLWNRALGARPRLQPVVVLLGPVGAGKTWALRSISGDCGDGGVHALFDFEGIRPATTVEVLTRIAFDLSRRWRARRLARFTRFTLGLIAVQASLDGMSREQAKEKLRVSIEDGTRNLRGDRVAVFVRSLADSATRANVLTAPVAETIKMLLPALIQSIARRGLRKAKLWLADLPEAEGAPLLDALVQLNRNGREQPAAMTAWLAAAFLADVRENHPRMAVPDPRSRCACDNPERLRHWHNWVLLLDNIDHRGGTEFVSDLVAARERHLRRHPDDHDGLLIIATSGRWNPDWESDWRAPWLPVPDRHARARTVPRHRQAGYEDWGAESAHEHPRPKHYPVLLEPLSIDETSRLLGTSEFDPVCILVQRATGGLPAAVRACAALLQGREPRPGARDLLSASDPATAGADLWRSRLNDVQLGQHLPDISLDEFVGAAPFATAPWLVPAGATSLIARPRVGQILTELRTALWVDDTELHPWVGRTLVSALARWEPGPGHPSYSRQFEALLNDPDTISDPARRAYCQLALGQISKVVDAFEASFDKDPHQDWIDRLRLVARAPDDRPFDHDCAELYRELVNADIQIAPQGRSPAGNIITRLVAVSWLAANPFAMPDPEQTDIIVNSYRGLPALSRRPDVAALLVAAQLAAGTQR